MPACAMVHPPPPTEATAALPAGASKVAITLVVVDTIQAPVPLHPPPFHPANRIAGAWRGRQCHGRSTSEWFVTVTLAIDPGRNRRDRSSSRASLDHHHVHVVAMEFSALNAFSQRPVETSPFIAGTEPPVLRMAFRI